MINKVKLVLENDYGAELTNSIIEHYEKALKQYRLSNWQYFGNEAGQFIEVSRRMIEQKLDGTFTPLSKKLPNFNENTLIGYENHPSTIDESFRILIPRCLYYMYCIRNKRGMIHIKDISPNKMDALVLMQQLKWVLAEFYRLSDCCDITEAQNIIDSIICKEYQVIWNDNDILRVLDTTMTVRNQVLCLLYVKDNQEDIDLNNEIEYSNFSVFKSRILRPLHKDRLIEYKNGFCKLSPKGMEFAEQLL